MSKAQTIFAILISYLFRYSRVIQICSSESYQRVLRQMRPRANSPSGPKTICFSHTINHWQLWSKAKWMLVESFRYELVRTVKIIRIMLDSPSWVSIKWTIKNWSRCPTMYWLEKWCPWESDILRKCRLTIFQVLAHIQIPPSHCIRLSGERLPWIKVWGMPPAATGLHLKTCSYQYYLMAECSMHIIIRCSLQKHSF